MTKSEHPVEAFERSIIENADHFTAFLQVRPGERINHQHPTRAQAETNAQVLADEFGKSALVYAVNREGRSAFVGSFPPRKKDSPQMQTQSPKTRSVPVSEVRAKDSLLARDHIEAETTYSAKSAAVRAARKELGAEAMPGADFILFDRDGRWGWKLPAAEPRSFKASAPATDTPVRERPQPAPGGGDGRPPRKPPVTTPDQPRMRKSTAEAFEAAKKGILPTPPDFSADTHKRFRPKLAELVALVERKDIAGLKAFAINPISTSPKAMDRFRNLAVTALEAQGSGEIV